MTLPLEEFGAVAPTATQAWADQHDNPASTVAPLASLSLNHDLPPLVLDTASPMPTDTQCRAERHDTVVRPNNRRGSRLVDQDLPPFFVNRPEPAPGPPQGLASPEPTAAHWREDQHDTAWRLELPDGTRLLVHVAPPSAVNTVPAPTATQ